MAKNNTIKMGVVMVALLVIAYIIYKSKQDPLQKSSGLASSNDLPAGCYPLEEVHEVGTIAGEMWVSLIPQAIAGDYLRPPSNTTSIGNQFTITNTNSALDGTYTINSIWYDVRGDIGALRVDIPSGYNFNYNATQNGDPRDMTFFGIGNVCLN
jgi:hypothetical protein